MKFPGIDSPRKKRCFCVFSICFLQVHFQVCGATNKDRLHLTKGSNSPCKGSQPILLSTASSPENLGEVLHNIRKLSNKLQPELPTALLCHQREAHCAFLGSRTQVNQPNHFPAILKENPELFPNMQSAVPCFAIPTRICFIILTHIK